MCRYTIGDNFYPKHNITKSMVGPLPLAPYHDYLQDMYHVYLMHQGRNRGVTNTHTQHKEISPFSATQSLRP